MTAVDSVDDVVVGAGIVGLAVAYQLARQGRRVVVFERHARAQGASIRNFGMIWPIGQPAGGRRYLAIQSRAHWQEVLTRAGIWYQASGSLHLAYHADELQVIEEFAVAARDDGFACEVLSPADTLTRSPRVRADGLRASLWSAHEMVVDPREVVAGLPSWLEESLRVQFRFGVLVNGCGDGVVDTSGGRWRADRCYLCSGDEVQVLFPQAFAALGLQRCKLQMMRTSPVQWRLGPSLAAGLTLVHYEAFAACPTQPALRARFAADLPDHISLGIHVMASQNRSGELTLGDSHEYDDGITPFDRSNINEHILEYLRGFLDCHDARVQTQWHGVYVKHPVEPYCIVEPVPGVSAVVGFGGAGMTMSFGAADLVTRR